MSAEQFHQYRVDIAAPQGLSYHGTVEVPVFAGWTAKSGDESISDLRSQRFDMLLYLRTLVRKVAEIQAVESVVVMHGGKRHYNASGLIQKLEELEIGRPSTFAHFVDTLLDKKYVKEMDVAGKEELCTEFSWSRTTHCGLRPSCVGAEPPQVRNVADVVTKQHIRTFGQERNKLVIQTTGILYAEFLRKYFGDFFAYDYTKKLEQGLDEICGGNKSWNHICQTSYADIQLQVMGIVGTNGEAYSVSIPVDEDHVVVFRSSGPCVRTTNKETNEVEYLPLKGEFDMERLKRGEYVLDDLVEFRTSYLGKYQGENLYIRKGPYGPYLAWGKQHKAWKREDIPLAAITWEEGMRYLEASLPVEINEDKEEVPNADKSQEGSADGGSVEGVRHMDILRIIDPHTSVRRGKYGPYLFHQGTGMKTPRFCPLKRFPGNFMECEPELLLELLKDPCKKKGNNMGYRRK